MKIQGLTEQQLADAMDNATAWFEDNLTFNRYPEPTNRRGDSFNLTLRVYDSTGPGAKRGPSGRRTVSANYNAHYAFMREVFNINPGAKITSAMATYNGVAEFELFADDVQYRNVGSMMNPIEYGDL